MLRAVIGKPGHGKSLYLLYCMMNFVMEGWTVATNMSLTEDCPFADRVIRLDDGEFPVFQLPEKATTNRGEIKYDAFWHYMPWRVAYVLDELDNLFDSMDFQKLAECSRDARLYYKQHRKREDVVIYAVQNLDNIWTRIRRMTESFVVCSWNYRTSNLFKHLPIGWSSFVRAEFGDASLAESSLMSEGRFWYREAKEMFSWYDTGQLVGDPSLYGWAPRDGLPARLGGA